MCAKRLPSRPSFTHLKNQAKQLLRAVRSGDTSAYVRCRDAISRFSALTDEDLAGAAIALQDCQLVVAREHGFEGWPRSPSTTAMPSPENSIGGLENVSDTEPQRSAMYADCCTSNLILSGIMPRQDVSVEVNDCCRTMHPNAALSIHGDVLA